MGNHFLYLKEKLESIVPLCMLDVVVQQLQIYLLLEQRGIRLFINGSVFHILVIMNGIRKKHKKPIQCYQH